MLFSSAYHNLLCGVSAGSIRVIHLNDRHINTRRDIARIPDELIGSYIGNPRFYFPNQIEYFQSCGINRLIRE